MSSRGCSVCHKDLPSSAFKKKENGSLYKICASCTDRMNEARKLRKQVKPSPVPTLSTTEPIDLCCLLEVADWTLDEVKKLVYTVKTYCSAPYRMKPKDVYQKYFHSYGPRKCADLIAEFKEAAQDAKMKGKTLILDDYWKNRTHRKGYKVLVKK